MLGHDLPAVAKDLYLGRFEVGRNVSLALGKEEYNKYERREAGLLERAEAWGKWRAACRKNLNLVVVVSLKKIHSDTFLPNYRSDSIPRVELLLVREKFEKRWRLALAYFNQLLAP
ncbi:hypothetical protein AOA57_26800 [Pseudomonas sp. 2588-5]|nr:hypothetical protein AOA57_26800 [Pseudomonas sp. 2588-5]